MNLCDKILAYVLEHEPANELSELLEKSGLPPDTVKMNVQRLRDAGLIKGELVGGLGNRFWTHVVGLQLTYSGLEHLANAIRPMVDESKTPINVLPIQIENLVFDVTLAKLF